MKATGRIRHALLAAFSLTLTNLLVSFSQLKIVLARLPVEKAGVWIIFLNFATYILLLDVGLSPTLGRHISFVFGSPQYNDAEKDERMGTLIRSCTFAVFLLSLAVYLAGMTGGWCYLRSVAPAGSAKETHVSWMIFLVGASLNLIGEGWLAGVYGLGRVAVERTVRAGVLLLGLGYMLVAAHLSSSLLSLAVAYVLQGATGVILARITLGLLRPRCLTLGRTDLGSLREIVLPSLKMSATLLGGVLILQTDNLVIASLFGTRLVPNYQAVAKIVAALSTLSTMLIVTSQPSISIAFASGDQNLIRHLLNRNLRFALTILATLGSFVACFADQIILVWLGPQHFVGFGIVWVFLTVMLLEVHHLAMAAAAMAVGKLVFAVPALLAGCLNIVFSIYLGKHLGLIGVALGTLFAQLLTNNWYCPWYAARLFRLNWSRHFREVIFPIIGLIALLIAAESGIRYATSSIYPAFRVLLGSLAAALVGFIYFYFLILHRDERAGLRVESLLSPS